MYRGPVDYIWYPLSTLHTIGLYHIANYQPYARPHANASQYKDVYQRPALFTNIPIS